MCRAWRSLRRWRSFGFAPVIGRVIPLLIRLTSPGGLISEAAQMRGQLLVAGVNTMAVGGCYSACTDLLMTGRVRWLASESTRMGFHRSGHMLGGDGGGQSPEDQAYVQWLID